VFGYYHISTVLPTLLVTPAYMLGRNPARHPDCRRRLPSRRSKARSRFARNTPRLRSGRRISTASRCSTRRMQRIDTPGAAGVATRSRGFRPAATLIVSDLAISLANGEPIARVPDFKLGAWAESYCQRAVGGRASRA